MLSHDQLKELFWCVVDTLTKKEQAELIKYWGESGAPFIYENRKEFDDISDLTGEIDVAATNGVAIFFDQEKIKSQNLSIIKITYHEIAHCLLFARDEFSMLDYKEQRRDRMEKCERRAQQIEKIWTQRLQANRVLLGKLRGDSRVEVWRGSQCLKPI